MGNLKVLDDIRFVYKEVVRCINVKRLKNIYLIFRLFILLTFVEYLFCIRFSVRFWGRWRRECIFLFVFIVRRLFGGGLYILMLIYIV